MFAVEIPLGPLGGPAFVAWDVATSWGEVIAFVTGALCVWLVAKEHVVNWPVGIVNVSFFFALFVNYGLYADAGLQLVYVALGAYGWWAWLRGAPGRAELEVSRTTPGQWVALGLVGVVGTAALWIVLVAATDSKVPAWDALTTCLSLLATWGQARKKLESWWIWIGADLIYVPLYAHKGLWLTAGLYVVFLALCIVGLREWRRSIDGGAPVELMPAPS